MRRAGLAKGVAIGVATLAIVLELVNVWVTARLPHSAYTPLPFAPEDMAGTAFPVFGAILVASRPRLVIGWLLLAGGLSAAANILSANLFWLLAGSPVHGRPIINLTWQVLQLTLGVLLPLLYPAGRLLSRRWLGVVALAVAGMALDWVAVLAGPAALRGPAHWTVSAAMALAFVSLVVRFTRGGPIERRQLLWLVVALPGLLVPWMLGDPFWWLATLAIPLIPAAIAVAVLRYRLFGIDTLISRALVGTGLAVVVTGVYVAVSAASSLFLSEVAPIAGIAAAVFAGAAFQPIRRGLQRGVDRLLYGSTGVPGALAGRLRHRLQHADPVHGLLATLDVLREGLSVTGVAVELDGTTTTSGSLGSAARVIPLVWHGEPVGLLLVGPTDRRRFPAAHDERVIATLTPYIADAAHAVRLTAALQRSRERILSAREEERRRLRRDLHDGLGQSLSGMAMSINAARLTMRTSPERADLLLAELRAGMDAVSGDIRQLVYGLRPPALDELGLAGAVEELAGTPIEVSGDLDGLPAAVEVAAYRIVQEALTNARKHAGAGAVSVALARGERLRVTVTDGGPGIAPDARPGVGLRSMRERAAELGGTCTVRTAEAGGTIVDAELPL
ncbi:Histidine kinase-, DNA gyrase B-, and HSP90-like ATPase [Nonomuraea solani]|uniref:histidine kinase n=1 Tax=Nonomuraea solani TaxID=1144553 RepID=A0A1H6DJH4_9ACTN|nr:sensor histidine kinase [Nonomuraea solani]SEG85324.1 Histidine kinase-, DNA gyrase B-, and HSP90-like ATPase [Nonomuraea solani]